MRGRNGVGSIIDSVVGGHRGAATGVRFPESCRSLCCLPDAICIPLRVSETVGVLVLLFQVIHRAFIAFCKNIDGVRTCAQCAALCCSARAH